MHVSSDKKLSSQLNDLTQEAVDKTIENHRLRGESIAISDEQGKVKVVTADEISDLQQHNLPQEQQNNSPTDQEAS